MVMTGAAVVLAGVTRALQVRPKTNRLRRFGHNQVMVESLDDWTIYQLGCVFDESSPEQQSQALDHYRVGLRLFPARAQDKPPQPSRMDSLVNFVVLCCFVDLFRRVHGWYRPLLFLVFYGWIWICM